MSHTFILIPFTLGSTLGLTFSFSLVWSALGSYTKGRWRTTTPKPSLPNRSLALLGLPALLATHTKAFRMRLQAVIAGIDLVLLGSTAVSARAILVVGTPLEVARSCKWPQNCLGLKHSVDGSICSR